MEAQIAASERGMKAEIAKHQETWRAHDAAVDENMRQTATVRAQAPLEDAQQPSGAPSLRAAAKVVVAAELAFRTWMREECRVGQGAGQEIRKGGEERGKG